MDESQGPGIRDLLFQMAIALLGMGIVAPPLFCVMSNPTSAGGERCRV